MIRLSQRGRAIVEQILASEEMNKAKQAKLWESARDPNRKVNHLSRDRKIITEFTRSICPTRISEPVLMTDEKSPKTNTIADGLIGRTSSMFDEIESKTMHKDKKSDQ